MALAASRQIVPWGQAVEEPTPRLWTREEFERLAEVGLLLPDRRYELIEGEILQLAPMRRPHAAALTKVRDALLAVFGSGHHVAEQIPVDLGDITSPQPDIIVVKGGVDDYIDTHPAAGDLALVVEVSDSTLSYDRGRKAAVYARAGIPDYWIVNLAERTLEVRREPGPRPGSPGGHGYGSPLVLRPGETVTALAAPAQVIQVETLFPKAAEEPPSE